MAQLVRFLITLVAMALAGVAFMSLASDWAWIAAAAIFLAGGALAEAVFRRLATAEVIRADLEDRVRNPPL